MVAPMITYRFRARSDEKMQELPAHRAGAWIDAQALTESDIEMLSEKHGLDKGHLSDAQDAFESPRHEQEGNIAYFFTRYPTYEEGDAATAPILIAVGDDFVLTVTRERPKFLDSIITSSNVFTTQKTKLFLQLVSAVAREYSGIFVPIHRNIRRYRRNLSGVSEKIIEDFVQLEYSLNEFISALVPTNVALQHLIAGKHLHLFEEDMNYMEDVQLENNQLIENSKSALKTLQNIRDAYTTIVSNRLSKTVRMLTALTILLTIPTIVGTLYGMNVRLPLQDAPYTFGLIVTFIALTVVAVTYLFSRNRWL